MADRKVPDYSVVKDEAKRLLAKYSISDPPVDPVAIARGEGLVVTFARFAGKYGSAAGFYNSQNNTIFVNKEEAPLRQTFTIAHELAHAKLHAAWANSESYKIFWRDQSQNDRDDPYEKEANSFAANLLVPRNMLDKYYATLTIADLSRLFAVSTSTIEFRLNFEYGI